MYLQNNTYLQGNKYQIVRHISSGGFGNTYEGIHVLLDKRVAIKEFFVKDFCNRAEKTAQVTTGITSKTALVEKLRKKFIDEAYLGLLGAIFGIIHQFNPNTPEKNSFMEAADNCDAETRPIYYQALLCANKAYDNKKKTFEILQMLKDKGFPNKIYNLALAYSSKRHYLDAHQSFVGYLVCGIISMVFTILFYEVSFIIGVIAFVMSAIYYFKRNKVQVYKSEV